MNHATEVRRLESYRLTEEILQSAKSPSTWRTENKSEEPLKSVFSSDTYNDVSRPLYICHLSYTDQLEDYISRYKRRPQDIKYWPYGPYWPNHYEGLLLHTPRLLEVCTTEQEPLARGEFLRNLLANSPPVENQVTQFRGKWRGVQIAYDSDRSPRDFSPLPVPEGCCPTLMFESRFECGNLRQARRVGQFEYELILKADLYTARHTQWYYFRVTNVIPGITYKLKIINLLKRDSLYNHGMRPLVYSEHDAREKQRGWTRAGHHISYNRNSTNHNCPLLERGVAYQTLEWQMEFTNANDIYYLAHCYPYSFTDLKEDLELLMNCQERSKVTRREVMCETRAGNSCFLLTVTNFDSNEDKTAVVVTARVHPGESQSSWMMKGLLEFITGQDPVAQKLRNKIVFKVVPMINPDGVIVGNYRCSLIARDLNRNYRHPRQDNFPTIWNIKKMMQELTKKHQIALYCDLHGHNRKPNVFMYGNNTSADVSTSPQSMARAFISDRLFPWIMSLKSPDRFHFKSCKFHIRRCKESTGRVVMWRQMQVKNSFTMEATFSGTVLDRKNCRHFNIHDFMDMGKILAQAILEYQIVQEDPAQYTQTVLGLTRAITEQVLASRRSITPEIVLTNYTQAGSSKQENTKMEMPHKNWTETVLSLCKHSRDQVSMERTPPEVNERLPEQSQQSSLDETTKADLFAHSKENVVSCLQKMANEPTLEDCVELLAHLDVQNAVQESSSSDSDSESEPEMKAAELKTRKKKRKSKKQRDRDIEKKLLAAGEKTKTDNRSKSALPTLNATYRPGGHNSASVSEDNTVLWQSKHALSEKWRSGCGMSGFVSKYEGRHNGGVPCFTEERLAERAAKRIAELRRKNHDPRSSDEGLHWSERADVTQEVLNHRRDCTCDESPNIQTTNLNMNIRTSYTHADNLKQLYTDNLHPLNGVNLHLKSTRSVYSSNCGKTDHTLSPIIGGKATDKSNQDSRLRLPLTVRRSPYNQPDHPQPRYVSNEAVVGHSNVLSSSARSTKSTAVSPTSNRFPPVDTSSSSGAINLSTSLIVNSLSKTTSLTATAVAPIMAASPTYKPHYMSCDHKNVSGTLKSEPLNVLQSLNQRSNNVQDKLSDLSIINNFHPRSPTVYVTDTQNETGNHRNNIGHHGEQEKPPNVGQLVNHLVQKLSRDASSLPASKRKSAFSNHGSMMDNLTSKTLVTVNHENISGNVDHGTDQ